MALRDQDSGSRAQRPLRQHDPRDNEKGLPREPFACATRPGDQAALSHIAVSNALLISGMFVPKPAFALAFVLAFGAGFSMTGAASAARSHDPFS